MDKVPGKGVACGSDVDEEKSDLELMPNCAPKVCGMEGSTIVDVNEGPTLDE
jgi:hypothetical protein